MTSDPAIETAAVALNLGWRDPLGLLALSPADWQIAVAIVNAASKIRAERDEQLANFAAGRIAQLVTEGVAAVVRSALKAFR